MDNTRLDYDRNLFESVYTGIAWKKNLPIFHLNCEKQFSQKFSQFSKLYNSFIDV